MPLPSVFAGDLRRAGQGTGRPEQDRRDGRLGRLFRDVAVSRHNAEQIHDPVPELLGLEIVIDCGRSNASIAAQAVSMAATQAAGTGRAPRCPCRPAARSLRIVECRGCGPPPRLDQRRWNARLHAAVLRGRLVARGASAAAVTRPDRGVPAGAINCARRRIPGGGRRARCRGRGCGRRSGGWFRR